MKNEILKLNKAVDDLKQHNNDTMEMMKEVLATNQELVASNNTLAQQVAILISNTNNILSGNIPNASPASSTSALTLCRREATERGFASLPAWCVLLHAALGLQLKT